jgi:hypothetical protein
MDFNIIYSNIPHDSYLSIALLYNTIDIPKYYDTNNFVALKSNIKFTKFINSFFLNESFVLDNMNLLWKYNKLTHYLFQSYQTKHKINYHNISNNIKIQIIKLSNIHNLLNAIKQHISLTKKELLGVYNKYIINDIVRLNITVCLYFQEIDVDLKLHFLFDIENDLL